MKSYTATLAKGDAIDRQISRVLKEFYQNDSSFLSYESFGKGMQLTESEKQEKYREVLNIELVKYMPFVKLASGKYLIGTRQRQLQLKGSSCLVRTASGQMKLADYLKRYSRSECLDLKAAIQNGDGSMKSTVISLLQRHKADKESVARWEKECESEMDQTFESLMNEVKQLDEVLAPLHVATPTKVPRTEKHSSGKKLSFKESGSKSKESLNNTPTARINLPVDRKNSYS